MTLLFAIAVCATMFGSFVLTGSHGRLADRLIIAGIFWLIATVALVGRLLLHRPDPDEPDELTRRQQARE